MTQPGSIVPPAPGWWVRSDRIGIGQGSYGWSGTAHGARAPQGHASGTYGWATVDAVGLKNLPTFIGASGNCNSSGSVAIPAHQVGDVIIIFTFAGANNTIPVKPSAGGTVPAWVDIDADNSGTTFCASKTVYFVATATNTTTGNWTTDGIIAAVIRGPGATPLGGHANSGGTAGSSGPTAPTITLTRTDGSSILLHFFGLRPGGSWNAYNAAPSGYTQRLATAEGAWGAVCLDTKDVKTSAPAVAQPVNADPTGDEYRGATVEIRAY